MKTLAAVIAATLAISLACAETASAQSVRTTTSKTDEFGNTTSFTKSRNSDGSESISKFTKDALGNKQRVTKTHNADGSESFSKFSADADGNKKKVTKTRNTDGSESVSITKTSTGSSAFENRNRALPRRTSF